MKRAILFGFILPVLLLSCDKDENNDYPEPGTPDILSIVLKAAGDSQTVAAKLDEFRLLLGDPLNNTPGQSAGRREVNWDGVPATNTNNNNFPPDFFNNTDPNGPNGRKRGLQYVNDGTLFRLDSSDFTEIDPSYGGQFEPFSRKKIISPVNTNISGIEFRIPGTTTPASVKGFGVIFSDVDLENSTTVEFFDGSKSLGVFKAPPAAGGQKFSFLGVRFLQEKITRIRIISGNAALATGVKDITTDIQGNDLVVIDDVLYSEPVAIL